MGVCTAFVFISHCLLYLRRCDDFDSLACRMTGVGDRYCAPAAFFIWNNGGPLLRTLLPLQTYGNKSFPVLWVNQSKMIKTTTVIFAAVI